MVKNALESEWEAIFEKGSYGFSYGFRPKRNIDDAINIVIRTATVGTSLIKGEEPANPLDKAFLATYRTKDENLGYRISIRKGDFQMVKKLTKVAL